MGDEEEGGVDDQAADRDKGEATGGARGWQGGGGHGSHRHYQYYRGHREAGVLPN